MNDSKKPATVKHTMTVEVEIPVENWIDYLTNDSEIFGPAIGYWARGVDCNDTGWLVWECGDAPRFHRHGEEPDLKVAMAAWKASKPLPKNWFRLDRDAAIRAWCEGVKRGGVGWFDGPGSDASSYDCAIQMALLGEIKYG